MYLSRKYLQYLFFLIVFSSTIFKAGNSNPLIQIFFIFFLVLFLLCLNSKNLVAELKRNYRVHKYFFCIFIIFLFYVGFQIIPFPIEWMKNVAPANYELYNSLAMERNVGSISIDPSNTYFQLLNYLNFFIIFSLFPILFNRKEDVLKFLFFVSLIGFAHAFFATAWMLIGNPSTFFIEKLHYLNSSTGTFINRSNFCIFLLLCGFSGLYYILMHHQKEDLNLNLIEWLTGPTIYVRFFILFITIGVITTLGRSGNFSYLLMLLLLYIYSFFIFRKFFNSLSNIIFLILIIDVSIVGFMFGGAQLIERYSIFNDFTESPTEIILYRRIEFIKFGIEQFKNFIIFGYGAGGFEQIFKIFFITQGGLYINHVHNDFIEFAGEFGVIGLFILTFLFVTYLINIVTNIKGRLLTKNHLILFLILVIVLSVDGLVDFSLHIPAIGNILSSILAVGFTNFYFENQKQ